MERYLFIDILKTEDGEPGLDNIETQEEFDMVSEVFDSIVEDGEYDEIIEE